MKKNLAIAFLLGLVAAFVGPRIGGAITTNPASAVTADSAATALTIPYRDANAAFDAGSLSNSLQAAPLDHWNRTKAQLDAITPARKGQVYFCTDCTVPNLCVSTGTHINDFVRADLSTAGCGTNN